MSCTEMSLADNVMGRIDKRQAGRQVNTNMQWLENKICLMLAGIMENYVY